MKACRDAGMHDIPLGPPERLQRSLSLTAGTSVPTAELDMWVEQLGLDPHVRGLSWSSQTTPDQLTEFSVLVIGAGMGGLNAAV
ncbi:MAG: hypothetical protein ACK5MR_00085 [Cumulibacter sp.]